MFNHQKQRLIRKESEGHFVHGTGAWNITDLEQEPKSRITAANINDAWYPPAPEVMEALSEALENIHATPEVWSEQLQKAVADTLKVNKKSLLLSPGSSPLIHYLVDFVCGPGKPLLTVSPTYTEYERVAWLAKAPTYRWLLNPADNFTVFSEELAWAAQECGAKLLVLANPNNPTGAVLPAKEIAALLEALPGDCFLLLDETYIDYAPEADFMNRYLKFPKVAVVRSLSKGPALAGVRAGYGVIGSAWKKALPWHTSPWNLSLFSQAAFLPCLTSDGYVRKKIEETKAFRKQLVNSLSEINGLTPLPTETNFFLVHLNGCWPSSEQVVSKLAEKGVLIRDCLPYDLPLNERYIRITTRSSDENDHIVKAFQELYLELQATTFAAGLIDLDGLLVKTEHWGQEALAEAWEKSGLTPCLSCDDLALYIGRPEREVFQDLANIKNLTESQQATLKKIYNQLYQKKIESCYLTLLPGVKEGLDFLKSRFPLALVTGSTKKQVEIIFNRVGLSIERPWSVLVTANDISQGKPKPDSFVSAAEQLGVPLHRCLVVEDSEPGILAGKSSGATVIHVGEFKPDISLMADMQKERLDEINDTVLEKLWFDRPLPSAPASIQVLETLNRVLKETGILKILDRMSAEEDDKDPWKLFGALANALVPENLKNIGIHLWELLITGKIIPSTIINSYSLLKELQISEVLVDNKGIASRFRIIKCKEICLLIEPPQTTCSQKIISSKTYLSKCSLNYTDAILKYLEKKGTKPERLLEVGIGSGIALIKILKHFPKLHALGVDIDGRAVSLARYNFLLNGIENRASLSVGDLLDDFKSEDLFDTIIFHPPYRIVPNNFPYPSQISRPGVEKDGLGLVRRFLTSVHPHLTENGEALIFLELPIHKDNSQFFEESLKATTPYLKLQFHTIGEKITAEKIIQETAENCLFGNYQELTQQLRNRYEELEVESLIPVLISATRNN